MNSAEATALLDSQPEGTYLITSISPTRKGSWVASTWRKVEYDRWVDQRAMRADWEPYATHQLVPVLTGMYDDEQNNPIFVWWFS